MKAEGSWGPEEDRLARVAQEAVQCQGKDSVAAAEGEVLVGWKSVTFSWQTL